MIQLSFKNRIASYYIITTALLIFVVFVIIYGIVSYTVYNKVNESINYEVHEYLEKIGFENNQVKLIDKNEWVQREHNEVAVNPVFLELRDSKGNIIEKSENLKNENLYFSKNSLKNKRLEIKLAGKLIKQIQVPIINNNKIKGYLLVAISLEEATNILNNLRLILFILFPIIMLLLFFVAQLIAGRSIKPIRNIIETSNLITKDNLKTRINLPKNRDELYILSETINNLLNRIETTIEREKQFTSDASHELRTPLTVIKGTLEVLIRKQRTPIEYEDKINFCIVEVDRLNHMVDQLLMLARFENQKQGLEIKKIYLNSIILDVLSKYSNKIQSKNIHISTLFDQDFYITTDGYLLSIIFSNLISNALKYSNNNGKLLISISGEKEKIECRITDSGIGIPSQDLLQVFNQFYRSYSAEHLAIKGTGLGLSIVKKLCTLLDIIIEIDSEENKGTTVILLFSN